MTSQTQRQTNQLVDTQLRWVELENIFLLVQRFDCELQQHENKKQNMQINQEHSLQQINMKENMTLKESSFQYTAVRL